MDQPFHVNHIEPAPKLVPHLTKLADFLKTESRMQADAGLVVGVNGRKNGVKSPRLAQRRLPVALASISLRPPQIPFVCASVIL
jgi:hypothetical protein